MIKEREIFIKYSSILYLTLCLMNDKEERQFITVLSSGNFLQRKLPVKGLRDRGIAHQSIDIKKMYDYYIFSLRFHEA